MKRYNEINIGDRETLSHTITREDLEKFVDLTGDDNRLHMDERFASATSFKQPVVHGMLGASFISTIIGTKLPGDGALWFSQTLEFLLPVRIGDELTITAEVLSKNDKEQIIELRTEIRNQNRQVVTKGIAKVKVIELKEEAVGTKDAEIQKEKTALIIGGTGGIGKAACIQLAKDGFNIVIHYNRNKAKAEEIRKLIENAGGKAIAVKADILDEKDLKGLVEKVLRTFGKIDALVNCAAIAIPNIKFVDLLWEDYKKQMELNIKATFSLFKEIVPGMILAGYGKIICIGSFAVDKPNSSWSHYITAKAALEGFTKSLAFELAPKGIRINLVTPSLVDTELTADIPEKVKVITAAQTPLRKLATVEDVAGTISYLASEKSDFLTGANIRLNGGQFMI